MEPWNPERYLRFGEERTRPAAELAARVGVESPGLVVDLGCGPGNSTTVLRRRWPGARVIGVDDSPEMIEAASTVQPDGEWILGDIARWSPQGPVDVFYSNATLQWLPDHGSLIPRLFSCVAAGGALAFQIPSRDFALVRTLIHETAQDPEWVERMRGALTVLTMESADFYYDHLACAARSVDIWETEYLHVMDTHGAIVEWISSTGLRPFLEALGSEEERRRFVARLQERVEESYQARADGRVLFPFRRLFVVAYA